MIHNVSKFENINNKIFVCLLVFICKRNNMLDINTILSLILLKIC